jgi:hypothetical protein
MSRLRNPRVQPRPIEPGSPEGDDLGLSDRMVYDTSPIPGGRTHLTNAPTERQQVPIPVPDLEYGGMMAHGVTPDRHTTTERAEAERGPNDHEPIQPRFLPAPDVAPAVPVFIVERAGGPRKLRTLASAVFTVPQNTGFDPIRIAGRDYTRKTVSLLVETAAGAAGAAPIGIRIAHELGDLSIGQGALVRAGGTSYLELDCQDELFALSADGSACTLSVLYQYEIGSGR